MESSRGFGDGELLQDGGRRIKKEADVGDEKDAEIMTRRARTKSEQAEHDEIMQLYAEGKGPLAPHFRRYGRSARPGTMIETFQRVASSAGLLIFILFNWH